MAMSVTLLFFWATHSFSWGSYHFLHMEGRVGKINKNDYDADTDGVEEEEEGVTLKIYISQ